MVWVHTTGDRMRPQTILALSFLLLTPAMAGCITQKTEPFEEDVVDSPTNGALSPYTSEVARSIKALSQQEIDDLTQGKGMGLAKAAELNRYPGPLHALDLADPLGLSNETRDELTDLRATMLVEAIELGQQIVQTEAELEARFADGSITDETLDSLVTRIAKLQGELRVIHLATHLKTRALMTDEQVAHYDQLRGYTADAAADSPHSHDPSHTGSHG